MSILNFSREEEFRMNTLKGRVAVITGAGRGIGREHALLFAAEGARVVVNDLGGNPDGTGADATPAQQVVDEIVAAGGEAVANHDDVTDWDGAKRLVDTAVEAFGDLHVLVNNAGILRDRMLVNMTEDEWDAVIRVHLKGHAAPLHHAAAYWRDQHKAGNESPRAVVNTSSTSGLFGNVGQTNYGAAKMGIGALTIIAAQELARYRVRVNAIAPAALTRLTAGLAGAGASAPSSEEDKARASAMDPANISPFVAYLCTEMCPITGRAFFVVGGQVHLFQPWALIDKIETEGRWTVEDLELAAAHFAEVPFQLGNPFGGG
jgi:NAD(P)-dependent dehydrogenase (short-subunit alcohol dehydrogenase family)